MSISIHLMIFILFSAGVAVYLFVESKKFERQGIIFLRKTKRYVNLIYRIADSNPVLWRRLSFLFIIMGFAAMLYSTYWVVNQTLKSTSTGKPALSLVLPSATGRFSSGTGYILVPLWLWIIAIICIAVPHEMFHGIMARIAGIRIRSVGIVFLAVIPGAFVEPDENQLSKAGLWQKLAVLSAGSGINISIGLALLLIGLALMHSVYTPYGVSFSALIKNSSAYEHNMSGVILEINGIRVNTSTQMKQVLENINAGTPVVVSTTSGNYTLEMRNIDGRPLIGIAGVGTAYRPALPAPWFWNWLMLVIKWIAIMEIGVGMANMLPIKPLDGGLRVEAVENAAGGKGKITNIITLLMLLIVAAGFIIPFALKLV